MKHQTHPYPAREVTAHLPVQLTGIDIAIAELLDEHSAMTTDQLTAILFDSRKQCRDRLRWLWKLDFVMPRLNFDWSQPESEHWMLTYESARFLARWRWKRSPTPAMVLKRQIKISQPMQRGEILEGNDLFAHLIYTSRNDPATQLIRWYSSATVAKRYRIATTAGHGVWREGNHEVGFFLHRAYKPSGRNWISELSTYAHLRGAKGPSYPALLILASSSQETQVHQTLAKEKRLAGIVATAVAGTDPLGPSWKPIGHPERLRLIELPSDHGTPGPNNPGQPSKFD